MEARCLGLSIDGSSVQEPSGGIYARRSVHPISRVYLFRRAIDCKRRNLCDHGKDLEKLLLLSS
jgi:hypothetical protein